MLEKEPAARLVLVIVLFAISEPVTWEEERLPEASRCATPAPRFANCSAPLTVRPVNVPTPVMLEKEPAARLVLVIVLFAISEPVTWEEERLPEASRWATPAPRFANCSAPLTVSPVNVPTPVI